MPLIIPHPATRDPPEVQTILRPNGVIPEMPYEEISFYGINRMALIVLHYSGVPHYVAVTARISENGSTVLSKNRGIAQKHAATISSCCITFDSSTIHVEG